MLPAHFSFSFSHPKIGKGRNHRRNDLHLEINDPFFCLANNIFQRGNLKLKKQNKKQEGIKIVSTKVPNRFGNQTIEECS